MQYRVRVRDAIVAALKAAGTLAGESVFSPRDLETQDAALPVILVHMPLERKAFLGKGGVPRFQTTATIAVVGRLEGSDPMAVEAQAELLCDQIAEAVLTGPVVLLVESFASVETQLVVSSEGEQHVGEAQLAFAIEFFEVFPPAGGAPLQIQATVADPSSGATLASFTAP